MLCAVISPCTFSAFASKVMAEITLKWQRMLGRVRLSREKVFQPTPLGHIQTLQRSVARTITSTTVYCFSMAPDIRTAYKMPMIMDSCIDDARHCWHTLRSLLHIHCGMPASRGITFSRHGAASLLCVLQRGRKIPPPVNSWVTIPFALDVCQLRRTQNGPSTRRQISLCCITDELTFAARTESLTLFSHIFWRF